MRVAVSALFTSLPPWAEPSKLPSRHPGPPREGRWARMLRWLADRRHLHEMDERLLRDVGLTREDVWRGMPFRAAVPRPAACVPQDYT